jgi:hypothetical protein
MAQQANGKQGRYTMTVHSTDINDLIYGLSINEAYAGSDDYGFTLSVVVIDDSDDPSIPRGAYTVEHTRYGIKSVHLHASEKAAREIFAEIEGNYCEWEETVEINAQFDSMVEDF